jgi:hypothetical protein
MAAVLWAGDDAAISHEAAAQLWVLEGFSYSRISVASPRWLRAPAGSSIIVHARWELERLDIRRAHSIRCTSVTRTLIDLAAELPPSTLEKVLDQALVRRMTTAREILLRLTSMGTVGRRRVGKLRELAGARTRSPVGDSNLEANLSRFMRTAKLPPCVPQYEIYDQHGDFIARVDFAYPSQRIAIQAESYLWHAGRSGFVRDLDLRNRLLEQGWRVLHVTSEDIRRRPRVLAARIIDWLRHGRAA